MNDLRKAAEMALEALEAHADIGIKSDKAVEALRQALDDKPAVKTYAGGKPNYCTPVDNLNINDKRVHEIEKSVHEWVGLTHEERDEIDQTCRSQMGAMFAVEAKLKEKNGG